MDVNGSATQAEISRLADGLEIYIKSLEVEPRRTALAKIIGISDPVLSFVINRSEKKISRRHTLKIEAFLQEKGVSLLS